MTDNFVRCPWCIGSPNYIAYHDQEWGVPRRDDATQFEFLILESAQAGLSWATILNKRDHYRQAFANFDPVTVAAYTPEKEADLLQNSGIVRNRLKISSAVSNARLFLKIAEKHGSFSNYLWGFVNDQPVVNHWQSMDQIPATTPLSECIAKDLKKQGFKFMGATIVYAHLQATGLVNDHLISCFRYDQIRNS